MRPRCYRCGRRVRATGHSVAVMPDRTRRAFCGHKVVCRRAFHEACGTRLALEGASTEALGSAIIAADFVELPWWTRMLPRSARDELRRRFAGPLAAVVEEQVQQRERSAES